MDGGDYSRNGQMAWLFLLCLTGLVICITSFYGFDLQKLDPAVGHLAVDDHLSENSFEVAAFILGILAYLGLLIFGIAGKPVGAVFLFLLLGIAKMICIGFSRRFAVPFAGTFQGFNLSRTDHSWYYIISDYFTSNFEWAIIFLAAILAFGLQVPSMPTLEATLDKIGKSDLLGSVKFAWTSALEPVNVPQSKVIATPEEVLVVPLTTAMGYTQILDEFKISEISKVEYSKAHNTRWDNTVGYPEEYLEVTFYLKDKRFFRRYLYLGESEEIINQNYPSRLQQILSLGKRIKFVELEDKKTQSGRKIVGVGGMFISEVSDSDPGD